jgi:hypothetical protein
MNCQASTLLSVKAVCKAAGKGCERELVMRRSTDYKACQGTGGSGPVPTAGGAMGRGRESERAGARLG